MNHGAGVRPPELLVRITKRTDGSAVLECVRADGSRTWQVQSVAHAGFFPLHDLTHYVLESEHGVGGAFYGLVADGWEIEDTTGKGARGALPATALGIEHVVGLLDVERATGVAWTAAELNAQTASFAADRGLSAPLVFTDDELQRIRVRLNALLSTWRVLPVGANIELPFDRRRFPVVG